MITEALNNKLRKASYNGNISESEIIRTALEQYFLIKSK